MWRKWKACWRTPNSKKKNVSDKSADRIGTEWSTALRASRRRLEELLWVLGLSRVTAPLWEFLRGGKALNQSRRMRAFYSALLPKGALVFDIGANVGTMTNVFVAACARVVAIDANPDCVRHVELTTSRSEVEIVHAAVGAENGHAVLKVSDRKDKMSSLSDEWREAVSKENHQYVGMWNREVSVPMITLDTLIERFGLPFYIKIDVEGYEDQVIDGLSQCPQLLSFEFNTVFLAPARRALESCVFDKATFNYTLVDPVKFELDVWVTRDDLESRILDAKFGPGLGDIFVRKENRD
jgi:FkbM family methyltransferase